MGRVASMRNQQRTPITYMAAKTEKIDLVAVPQSHAFLRGRERFNRCVHGLGMRAREYSRTTPKIHIAVAPPRLPIMFIKPATMAA